MNLFRYVEPLTEEQKSDLLRIMNTAQTTSVQKRAHAILLSNDHYTLDEIANICFVDRDTVARWLDWWEQDGPVGLWDNPRPGRKTTLSEPEQQLAKELIEEIPNDPKAVLNKLLEKTGKSISRKTLNRIAKKYNLKWKRIKKSLK
jgi:transposase